MPVVIQIDMGNDSFADSPGTELSRILRKLSDEIKNGYHPSALMDSNGNTVGSVVFNTPSVESALSLDDLDKLPICATAGPWCYDEFNIYRTQNHEPLAMLARCESAEQRIANARLMAAAPNLLMGLRGMLSTYGRTVEQAIDDVPPTREEVFALAAIRLAVGDES